jgi:hypothetical protein
VGSPYRALAEVPPDPPERRRAPRGEPPSGFGVVVLLWLTVFGMAVLSQAFR